MGQKIKIGSKLDVLFSEKLIAFMSSLAGARLSGAHPQLLLSFPHKEDWTLTRLNWHLDLAVPRQDQVSGVQAFALIDDVKPRGGATLALAGSHRLPYLKGHRNDNPIAVLREHTIFKELFSATNPSSEIFFQPQQIEGIDVHVLEMEGRAGDVYLMDMRVPHSPSINATKNIRMMATNRFIR